MKRVNLNNGSDKQGFTLIELIVTMAVLAIVLSIAAPSFNNMITNNRSTSMASELTGAVNFARSEAIKRAKRVSICPSSNGTSCLTSSDWAKGWLIFVDKAASDSATPVIDSDTIVLNYWDKLDAKAVVSLKKGNLPGSPAIDYVRFNPQGMLARSDASDGDVRTFEVYITGCKGDAGRKITIGVAGMINTKPSTCP
jgi:type IV fimbrial biogenesis protein FimT